MAEVAVPDFSKGWITDPVTIADTIFAHFLLSEHHQSYIHLGEVSSLPYILQNHSNDPEGYCTEMKKTLSLYFGKYFPSSEVEVFLTNPDSESSAVEVSMSVKFEDSKGQSYSLSKVIQIKDSVSGKIISLMNQ